MLEIIFEDEYLIAVNKPNKLLVHKTSIDRYETQNAQDILGLQLGKRVFPLHRLDKATSGILLFSKDQNYNKKLHEIFVNDSTEKEYLAVCRGYTPSHGTIDKAIKNPEDPNSIPKSASTSYLRLGTAELPIPVSRYQSCRYSLVQVQPHTGRMHQIRMHFAHLRHYIIGDSKHGERHHNKIFKEQHGLSNMFLHARRLAFIHPLTSEYFELTASVDESWNKCAEILGWESLI